MTPDTFLTAENIVKRFGTHTALDGVSISVPRGRVFGLLGPNGAGKTTLIRIINRITVPDSGTITFDGHPFGADDVQRIGYLPEERGLYKKMKVGEQAVYLASLRGLSAREAKARLKAWFEKFGIESWWNKKLEELSKGMQQKVQFIITAVHEPDLLILDEPFSGFDPVNAELLKKEILALRDKGATIIFSTHNMASVEEVCDDIALIHKSHVVLQGQVTQIKEEHRTGCYEVVATEGTLKPVEGVFDVTGSTAQRHVTTYRLAKAAGVSNADLARAVAAQVEPRSFCEVMPSMNEIFLKIVGA
ncbi:MAG: ABC transporter ATP-binding protein [Alloprevotella sp.]|nr:ABC transporter ATP-binding protein [Alloprevotella sp.]